MKGNRFLSTDIDPAQQVRVNDLKEQALDLIHRELAADSALHDAAAIAILNDFDGMRSDALLHQLRAFVLTVEALKGNAALNRMMQLLTALLRAGIPKVDGEALDALTIRRDALQVRVGDQSTLIGTVNADFINILSLCKESRETERQLMVIEQLVKNRNDETLHSVADAFKISFAAAQRVTRLIGTLFDGEGNFIRTAFEPIVDELAGYGNHAFELLWCYFKVLKVRASRVAFLNALQYLIKRIKRPKHALRFLLADFCRHPDRVLPEDRNAIMLANILLRRYNQELDVDIEKTPEEVLNVRNGIDQDVVRYAQFRIDSMDYRFSTKVRTIHEWMVAQLAVPVQEDAQKGPTVRHLLFLEREIFIFLALLAGKTAHLILASALNEYGDVALGIYRNAKSRAYLPVFLQHLKIIVRGIGRVGTREDVGLLRQINENGLALSQLNENSEYQRSVVRTMAWVENSIRSISNAGWQEG
jgi:hypothetical protein